MKSAYYFQRISVLCFVVVLLFSILSPSTCAINYEYAVFPNSTMTLSQIAYEAWTGTGDNTYASHGSCNAIDILPDGRVFAPFTGKITYIDPAWGYVLFESLDKVYYADGSLDYMTIAFMHDSYVDDLYVGQELQQYNEFYDAGGMGNGNANAYYPHVDISVFRGHKSISEISNYGCGDTYAHDALFVNPSVTIIQNPGIMEANNYITNDHADNWTSLWCELPSNRIVLPDGTTPTNLTLTVKKGSTGIVRTEPRKAGDVIKKLPSGTQIHTIAFLKNQSNNIWYYVEDYDGWLWLGAVTPSASSDAHGSSITGPTDLAKGRAWGLTGTVYSDPAAISSTISVYVKNTSNGKTVLYGEESFSEAYTLSNGKIDLENMLFNSLDSGTYTYEVHVQSMYDAGIMCCNSDTILFSSEFSVY